MKSVREVREVLQKGFTLIELIVVIAILGVLAVVLVTTIDPLDKINSANDAGIVRSVAQFGKSMDSYGASHNNYYLNAANTNAALTALQAAGETKITSYTPPSGTVTYLFTPAACTSGSTCTGFAFFTGAAGEAAGVTLKSKKNTSGTTSSAAPFYQYVNGKGCFVTTVITQAQLTTLGAASSGAGACP